MNAVRMPAIGICAINPVGGYLQCLPFKQHGHCAMGKSRRHNGILAENLFQLLRQRGGRDVPVLRHPPHQRIAHASANSVGFIPGSVQPGNNRGCGGRKGEAPRGAVTFCVHISAEAAAFHPTEPVKGPHNTCADFQSAGPHPTWCRSVPDNSGESPLRWGNCIRTYHP